MIDTPQFIILGHQRSGTHFLQSLISSHPSVHGRGEFILHYKRLNARAEFEEMAGSERFRYVFQNMPGYINVGIVMYSQMGLFEELCGSLKSQRVIHLLRDPLAVALSVAQMKADREALGEKFKAHYRMGESMPTTAPVALESIAETEQRVAALQAEYRQKLAFNESVLTVKYDEMTLNQQVNELAPETSKKLLDFIGLDYRPLRTQLQKTGKVGALGSVR